MLLVKRNAEIDCLLGETAAQMREEYVEWNRVREAYLLNSHNHSSLQSILLNSTVITREPIYSNKNKSKTPETETVMDKYQRANEMQLYFDMVSEVMTEKERNHFLAMKNNYQSAGQSVDNVRNEWMELKRILATVFNVMLSGVSVFVFILYYARGDNVAIKWLLALFGAIGVVCVEVALICLVMFNNNGDKVPSASQEDGKKEK